MRGVFFALLIGLGVGLVAGMVLLEKVIIVPVGSSVQVTVGLPSRGSGASNPPSGKSELGSQPSVSDSKQ